jgi:hypothetical protein
MRLVISGDQSCPQKKVSPGIFLRIAKGHKKAFFDYKSEFAGQRGLVTITLTNAISVDMAVKDSELPDVWKHENRHCADFKNLVSQLRTNMQRWLLPRKDATQEELQNWLDWFDYDHCVVAANFHRSIGAMVNVCLPPSTPRPR